MKTWIVSLDGAITLSLIALLTFMGRTFADYQYVFPMMFPQAGQAALGILLYIAVFGGWLWGLLAAARGSRRGLIAALGFDLLLWLGIAVGTLVSYCPSPCNTAWPLMEIANWANLLFGLLAAIATGLHLRAQPRQRAA